MRASLKLITNIIGWLITLTTPVVLVLSAVRMLLTPVWVQIEYRLPGFPEDPFGFTLQDRLRWSLVSLDYLLNDEGIAFLENQRFTNNEAIYNVRELRHMEDVKAVVTGVLNVWLGALGFVIATGLIAKWGGWAPIYRLALLRGSWLTMGFVGAVLVFVLLAFGVFFVYFHQVFFDPGTWTFSYSDTLIRLFPMRFWQDAFLWIGGLTILEALWLISLVRS